MGSRGRWGWSLLCALVLACAWAPGAQAHLYWANDTTTSTTAGAIERSNLDGTSPANRVASLNQPEGIAVDGNYLYYTEWGDNTIDRANLDGSSPNASFITGAVGPSGLAVDSKYIYWGNFSVGHAGTNTIGRADLDGTAPVQDFIKGATTPISVAVDSSHIYWADYHDSSIGRANLDGSGLTNSFIPNVGGQPMGVAVDGTYVYWTTGTGNTIGRANLDGSNPNPNFISGALGPAGVAVDSRYVYWANNTGSNSLTTIGRADLDGSDANEMFTTASNPFGVAVNTLPFASVPAWVTVGVPILGGGGSGAICATSPPPPYTSCMSMTIGQAGLSEPGAHASVPDDGVITSWRFDGDSAGFPPNGFKLRVLRPAGNEFTGAGTSALESSGSGFPVSTTLPVEAGDDIGIDLYGGSFQTILRGEIEGGSLAYMWQPALVDSFTGPPSSSTDTEFQFNAVVAVDAPIVSSISPTSGPTAGGTSVIIAGSHLANATSVTFGGAAASITASSNSLIVATAPAGNPGTVDITVSTLGGPSAASGSDQFTYVAPPSSGGATGGGGGTAGGGGSTGGGGGSGGGGGAIAPTISSTAQSHLRWRRSNALARFSRARTAPVGTTFSFLLNEPATVSFVFAQRLGGRRAGNRCVAPSPRNRHKPRCTRTITVATLRFAGHAGLNRLAFFGRVSKSLSLRVGRYAALITAGTASGTAAARPLSFTIVG